MQVLSAPPQRAASGSRGSCRARRALGALLAAVLLVAGCDTDRAVAPATAVTGANGTAVPVAPTLQSDDVVDLTVYFRSGSGASARLEPVVREVPVDDDLPRRALELLLAGPGEDEGDLAAPLPTTTEVNDLSVEAGTAHVDLSRDVILDAASVGPSPEHEALALAALVDTLTEFTSIEQVELTIDGQRDESEQAFWGGWGLPEVLVRDESLLADSEGEGDGIVDLRRFTDTTQQVGVADREPVRVSGVRVRERVTHTRIIVELADADDDEATGATVPVTRVRHANGAVILRIGDVAAFDGAVEPLAIDPQASAIETITTELDESRGVLRLTLTPRNAGAVWLHTLANPTRIVLDVKR
jgi:hypothetical protein